MSAALFVRLLKAADRAGALANAISALRAGLASSAIYAVDQNSFRMLPEAPFAYWVSDAVRATFRKFPKLESDPAAARRGPSTGDDERRVRAAWEVAPGAIGRVKRWVPLSKGGEFSPFYADVHLLVAWDEEIRTFAGFLGRPGRMIPRPEALEYFFRPGLTWPRRTTSGLSVRVMPEGCIFADKGPALFTNSPTPEELWFLLALCNSKVFEGLVGLMLGAADVAARSYEVGTIQRVPVPPASREQRHTLRSLSSRIHELKRALDTTSESAHVFTLPALLQQRGPTLADRLAVWNEAIREARGAIEAAHREIDEICYRLYEVSDEDRRTLEAELGTDVKGLPELLTAGEAVAALVSWAVGVAMARFDVRLATGERPIPDQPDPFTTLPACSPGVLPDGMVPLDYPLRVAADGILVDDEGHDWDMVARVRDVFQLPFGERADAIEREACQILGVGSLGDYLDRLGTRGFWDDHVKRYSRSRRRAPIYWLLRSPRGLYSAWIYYHRLDRDTLHRLLGPRYLESKIQRVRQAIEELRPGGRMKPSATKKDERRLADLDALLVDLEEFRAKIQTVLRLPNDRGETVGYEPDLDDGVLLNAAPLHELIPWPRKTKHQGRSASELAVYWDELSDGEYDWSRLAMRYRPTRVTEKCRTDKSLALAHGLDAQFFPGLHDELRRQAEAATTAGSADDSASDSEVDDQEDDA